jgi:radical SAM superfamily enzyme YgiQ (UPF0313 family)
MHAASYVKQNVSDSEVYFRDSIALRDTYPEFYNYVETLRPDYIILESATPTWEHDRQQMQTISALCPGVRLILTGPIVAARGAELLSAGLYAAVKGEGERGITRVLNGKAQGLVEFDLMSEYEMNDAPPPWNDMAHWQAYWDSNPKKQQWPQLQAWTSRGCFALCSFCSWPATMTGNDPDGLGKRRVRHYHAPHMEAYLSETFARYPYKCVYFDDDLFDTSDAHVREMCAVMRKIKKPWSAMCRVDTLKPETWREMKESHCFGVKVGLEVGSQRVMDEIINKRLNIKEAIETLRMHIKPTGLTVHATFMVGLPGETREEQQQTLDLIRYLYDEGLTDTHQLSGAAALEGTPLEKISRGESLAKYPGAHVDDNYTPAIDGSEKIRRMPLDLLQ